MKRIAFIVFLILGLIGNIHAAVHQASIGNGYLAIVFAAFAVSIGFGLVDEAKSGGGFIGYLDEYGTIWDGEPGASNRIGDAIQCADEETFEIWICEC